MQQQTFSTAQVQFAQLLLSGEFTRQESSYRSEQAIAEIIDILKVLRTRKGRVYLIGNGGSAAVAGHICTDLLNVCKLSAQVLHEAPQLTCFCNDYGYEQGYARQLEIMARPDDLLIAISSSGRSENIINTVAVARAAAMNVFTLTGFEAGNPLRQQGDWNYWLDSNNYGQVEIGHLFLLHHICNQMN